MPSGQLQRSIFLQLYTFKILRDDRMLLLQLSSSSFSPKLTKLSHSNTSSFLSVTRILLASASDFTRYLISLQFLMLNSSTAPRDSVTPPHTTSLSPEIRSISNLVTPEATSTRLLNIPLSHLSKFRTFNEGSASSVASTKLGQPFISSFFKRGNTAPVHFFHPCISTNLIISSDGNARPDSNNSKATTSTPHYYKTNFSKRVENSFWAVGG
ncbi:hypothetical protein HanHA300_Chr13g0501041 [Helianthus annuus]|nr:hypothetical protein HanHA300_Chr13g0501041 [Helianthus annuus]KAJ0499414.1 hypothetical protein HanHA89_Chr13g0533791 [Helianthus annuus]